MAELLEVEEALALVLARVPAPVREDVSPRDALGRRITHEVRADRDYPAFPRSRVDGYALRAADAVRPGAELPVVMEIPAGVAPGRALAGGEAARIFTGAPLPDGADAVVMQEHCEALPGAVRIGRPVETGACFVAAGSECRRGEIVAAEGDRVTPALAGALASVGAASVGVHRRPRGRVISTGDELVPVSEEPPPGRIRNSNAPALCAALAAFGALTDGARHAADDEEALHAALEWGLEGDVCLLTGGVSVGDYDLVPAALEALGVERVFHGVRMQPGKPVWFGVRGDTLVFGLPGNPVSALVTATLFVWPAVRARFDGTPPEPTVRARLEADLGPGKWRRKYVPVRWSAASDGARARPVPYRGSGDVFGFSRANALAIVPAESAPLRAGDDVDLVLLPDGRGAP